MSEDMLLNVTPRWKVGHLKVTLNQNTPTIILFKNHTHKMRE